MRFHRFDAPEGQLPRPIQPRMSIAQFERMYRTPIFLRAQCSRAYELFRGRA